MTDDDLLGIISQQEQKAIGYLGGDLASERAKALNYYHGQIPDLPSNVDESQMVSTDVRDAVDGMLPDLMEIFLSSDDAVRFEPSGPEDTKEAAQATQVVNHVFYKQNPGTLILLEWQKTALLEKNAFVKYWWDTRTDVSRETYQGLTDVQLQQIASDPEIQITAHTGYPAQLPGLQGPVPLQLHDVELRISRKAGKCCVEGVPPENMLVSLDHASLSLAGCPFIGERGYMTASDLREMGLDPDSFETGSGGVDPTFLSPEWTARRRLSDERFTREDDASHLDPALKNYPFLDAKVRADWDGDGIAELRRVLRIGNRIAINDDCDDIGFAAICPDILPYRFYGLSIADLVMDIQKLKSVIWRQMLNSLYLSNNPRTGVMENAVNMDDLLVSRAGGVVRFKVPPQNAWMPMEHRFVGQQAFPMLEYSDAVKENRTGFTRYSQGTDASSLNKTATGITLISGAAGKRMRMIARIFAETGMKDLFRGILHMTAKYNTKPMTMRLRNQWVNVDPRQWKTGWDMTVNVGIGAGDRQQELQHLQTILATMQAMRQAGMAHMVTDQNLYNAARRLAENAGYKQEGEFFTPPGPNNPPTQQPPPPEIIKIEADKQMEQMRLASEEKKKQAEIVNAQSIAKIQAETTLGVAKINAAVKVKTDEDSRRHETAMKIYEVGSTPEIQDGKASNEALKKTVEQAQAFFQRSDSAMEALVAGVNELVRQGQTEQETEVMRDGAGNLIGTRRRLAKPTVQ